MGFYCRGRMMVEEPEATLQTHIAIEVKALRRGISIAEKKIDQ